MNKLMVMNLAFGIVEKLADSNKISHAEYLHSVNDIQAALNISEKELGDSLDEKWFETPADFYEVN